MISIFLESLPEAKKRHRSGIRNNRVVTYDPQKADKIKTKWDVAAKLREKGLLKPLEGPIEIYITSFYPWPKSWSKKRVKAAKESGSYKTSKPDVDNEAKWWLDILNGIAWKDDAQVVQSWSEKRYSDKPGIEITLQTKEVHMKNEHAITIREKCSIEEISFLVKKANRLGKMNRDIYAIFSKDDGEGSHIYFEVDDLKPLSQRRRHVPPAGS